MIDRITLLLKTKNITASQFADEVGVQRSSVSHVLSGRNKPSLDFIQKILKKYPEINPDWLLFGKGAMNMEFNLFSEISDSIPVREEAIDMALKRQDRPMRVVPEKNLTEDFGVQDEEEEPEIGVPVNEQTTVPEVPELQVSATAQSTDNQTTPENQGPVLQTPINDPLTVQPLPQQNSIQNPSPQEQIPVNQPYYPPFQAPQYIYPPVNPYFQQPYQAPQQPFMHPGMPMYYQGAPIAPQQINPIPNEIIQGMPDQPTPQVQAEHPANQTNKTEPAEVKTTQSSDELPAAVFATEKEIEKIMVFYKDKTFVVYKPE
jgi:transcriptional regulator with XRE-family HTH domain